MLDQLSDVFSLCMLIFDEQCDSLYLIKYKFLVISPSNHLC